MASLKENTKIDALFNRALDKAVPETWTTLELDQLIKLKTAFARLIIDECAKVADENYNKGFCPVGGFIKDHFDKLTMMHFTLD